jgi:hypothetical protein
MPLDALSQLERQLLAVLGQCPAFGEVGDDIVEPVLLLLRIEHDKVVHHPHHRHQNRDGAVFEDRHVAGAVAVVDPQGAAGLLRDRFSARQQRRQRDGRAQ